MQFKFVVGFILLTICIALAGLGFRAHSWANSPLAESKTAFLFVLKKNDSDLCPKLKARISSVDSFSCWVYTKFLHKGSIAEGPFKPNTSMSPKQIFSMTRDSEFALKELSRDSASQRWFVDVVGPANDYDIVKAVKKDLLKGLFDKPWMIAKGGTAVVEADSPEPNQKIVSFYSESREQRIKMFRESIDLVFLFRVWVKREESIITATYSAFKPPKGCIGEGLDRYADRCKNWERSFNPGVFKFDSDLKSSASGIVRTLKTLPFK